MFAFEDGKPLKLPLTHLNHEVVVRLQQFSLKSYDQIHEEMCGQCRSRCQNGEQDFLVPRDFIIRNQVAGWVC